MDGIIQAGHYLRQQLREVTPDIIRTQYPELWGYEGKHHTVQMNLPFGLREIWQSRIDHSGVAVNFGGKATDIPLANFGIGADKYKTVIGVLGAEWDWMELQSQEQAMKANLPTVDCVTEYRAALEKGLREWVHLKTLFGDTTIGFNGLFNHAEIEVIDTTTNLNTATSRDLQNFFRGIIKDFKKNSRLTASPTKILGSIDLIYALNAPFTDAAGAVTAKGSAREALLTSGDIASIDEVNELSNSYLSQFGVTAASTTKDAFILYEPSAETLYKRQSRILTTPVGLKDDQMTYRTTGLVAVSEVIIKRPYRVKIYTYPKF
ncbi:hypothetical protein NIES2100_05480 [Calothrix sp. NIES-2100]|uniref:major capsid family protein n=1 Tax=Calothrix sp. NIES-2100 TaxID=1954172 RepID=UPI000B621D06|nr:hypothetical protein NIES2100_05480 [Calothrix sp. NIES-2100]